MHLDMIIAKIIKPFNVHFNLYKLSGIDHLVSTLKDMTYLPNRKSDGNFVFSVDHCFSIKGQGTILTGTIIQGAVSLNDVSWFIRCENFISLGIRRNTIIDLFISWASQFIFQMVEISALKETRKVKSIQMFRKPVNKAKQGDRIGLCVTQFEASQLERGLVASPGYLPTVFGAIISIKRISYYKGTSNPHLKQAYRIF